MATSISMRAAAFCVLVALPAIGIQFGNMQKGPLEGDNSTAPSGTAELNKAMHEDAEDVVTEDNLLMDDGEDIDASEEMTPEEALQKEEARRLSEFQEFGLEPGCFVRTPTGCPSHPSFHSETWKREVYGERYKRATENRTVCEVDRRVHVAHWCGAEDAETLFVPKPPPGCYVRTPSGCPNHPAYGGKAWQHEEYGEKNTDSKENKTECEIVRKVHIEHWCGIEDIETLFVPAEEESLLIGDRHAPPNEPGCFVRTPRGCPNQPNFASMRWKHDQYAERYTFANTNRTACEVQRRQHVMRMCGTSDVEMAFTPSEVLQPPREPGCFFRTPAGCPKHPKFGSASWEHEEYGERSARAGMDRTVCEVHRKEHVAHWCGTRDVEMLFVPPPEPGCYVRTPTGCPSHPSFGSAVWKHEEYGEKHTQATGGRIECEIMRKQHVAHWCGADDVEMLYIPKDTAGHGAGTEIASNLLGGPRTVVDLPSEPGCFVRTPTGCPNKQHFSAPEWRHELYGELHKDAKLNRTSCEVARKAHLAHWCGTDDIEVLFIPANTERVKLPLAEPTEPGCHVVLPSGCPKHPTFGQAGGWSHEKWGETYTDAKSNRQTCETTRGEHIRHWCGANDAHTRFVPEPGPSSSTAVRRSRNSRSASTFVGGRDGNVPEERRRESASISNEDSTSTTPGAAARSDAGASSPSSDTSASGSDDAASRAASTADTDSTGNSSTDSTGSSSASSSDSSSDSSSSESSESSATGSSASSSGSSSGDGGDAAGGPADGFFGFPDASTTHDPTAPGSSSGLPDALQRPADPAVPGCYVWTPSGCKKHPSANATGWRREVYGELFANAAKDKHACEVKRKANINEWCGIEDAQMKFVDEMEAAQHEDTTTGSLFAGPTPEGVMMFFDLEADFEALLLAETPIQRL